MFKKSLLGLSVLALTAVGCGGDDTTTTGTDDLSTVSTGADLFGAKLQSGTYNVSSIVKVSDGCGLVFEGDANDDPLKTLAVVNTGGNLSLGTMFGAASDPVWSPPGYSAGTGPYTDASHATLSAMATVTLPDGCSYSTTRTTQATFTGTNMLSVDFTDSESGQSSGCTAANGDNTAACTSEYTFNLAM